MNLMYSIFFGAGAAAFAYAKMSRRVGRDNVQSITVLTIVVFVLTSIVFFTILSLLNQG